MMSKIHENGIVSAGGDCPQSPYIQSLQAKESYKSEFAKGNEIMIQYVDDRRHFAKKISGGDNVGIVLDQAKVDRPDSCPCCKNEIGKLEKLWDRKRPTRVIYWEKPKAEFKGTSITARDYIMHDLPKRETPPWHPYRIQPWKSLDVPSITETTYRRDFPQHRRRVLPLRTVNMQ